MKYVTGDPKTQLAAIEMMEKEFLTLVWNQGYEGQKERYERISKALEECGQHIDIYWVWALFSKLERVAIKEIDKLAHLAQAGVEAIELYPDLPSKLKENIKGNEQWIKINKRNKEISKNDRVRDEAYYPIKSLYESKPESQKDSDFIRHSIKRTGAKVTEQTVRNWIGEWKKEKINSQPDKS